MLINIKNIAVINQKVIPKRYIHQTCFPENIKNTYHQEADFISNLMEIPNHLIKLPVSDLEKITLWIIKNKFDARTSDELYHTFFRCKKAHDDTKEVRDSGQPQFHHVLTTTLVSWVYAQTIYNANLIDLRELFLSCLYHDTIEDTKIFNLKDSGKQICKIAEKHGENIAINVGFLTKMALHVDRKYQNLRDSYLSAHFITFSSSFCPFIARFIKGCDRIANFADFEYSEFDFFVRKLQETFTFFENIIFDQNNLFKEIFWKYINSKAEKHGLEDYKVW